MAGYIGQLGRKLGVTEAVLGFLSSSLKSLRDHILLHFHQGLEEGKNT